MITEELEDEEFMIHTVVWSAFFAYSLVTA